MSYPLVQPQIPYQSQGPPKRARSWSDEASMMTGESRGAHHTEQRFTQAHDSSPRQRLTHAHDPSPRKRMRHNYKPKARDNTVKKLPPYFYNSTLPTPRSNPQPPQPQPTGGNPHIHSGQHSLSSQQYPVDLIMQDPDPRELATLPRPGIPISNNTTTQVSSLHPDTTVNLTEVTVEDLTHLGSTGAHDRGTIPKTTSTFTFALGAPSVRTVSNTAAAATSALHPDTNVNLIEVTMEDPTHLSPTSATNEENQQQNTTFTSALGARGAREDANTAAVADSTSSNNEEKQQNITFTSALSAHSVREVSNVGVEATAAQAALAADNLSPEEKTEGQEGFGWRMEE
ncbi:hypothetical protein EJ04DRAFT_559461 [Polyplosphaeria fusca]|uniref:Uncharacterized protein n=1 Tax=Polyplosphaeria fusca TaxID=682080 RepID=A0A9P4RBI4_9PLEO|nr:hypothetical protein EJ04DRAFT_559461 [Polyplosphaeria fusca]